MLKQAAIDAVGQWRFGCQHCELPLSHIVTVSFVINRDCAACREGVEPALPERVTIRKNPFVTDDPGVQLGKRRSLRCLFLSRCSYYRWH
jgi:hypothetical protein